MGGLLSQLLEAALIEQHRNRNVILALTSHSVSSSFPCTAFFSQPLASLWLSPSSPHRAVTCTGGSHLESLLLEVGFLLECSQRPCLRCCHDGLGFDEGAQREWLRGLFVVNIPWP